MNENRTPALMAAQAVALSARTRMLTQHAVDDMRTRAEELLDRDDPMRAACLRFATKFEEYRRDLYALEKLGEELERELTSTLSLDGPASRHRSDIDD